MASPFIVSWLFGGLTTVPILVAFAGEFNFLTGRLARLTRLGDCSGLDVVSALREHRPDIRAVILTGYGNIATAVAAVKAGAVDYLPKPADADAIENALLQSGDGPPPPPENPMSADRVRWEHILRVFEQCDRNVSETARRLKMHRRTLQRILNKHAPRN